MTNTATGSISGDTDFSLTLDQREHALGPVDVPEGSGLKEIEWTPQRVAELVIRNDLHQEPAPSARTTITPNGVNLNGDDDLDVLLSMSRPISVYGGFGEDVLSASPGVTSELRMYGGAGADSLDASGARKAFLFGNGSQSPTLDGSDRLVGGTRWTHFDGGYGPGDILHANSPKDHIAFSEWGSRSSIRVDLGASTVTKYDDFTGRNYSDALQGVFENVSGGPGNDVLKGNDLDNALNGGVGQDRISGNAGDDVIQGAAGIDYVATGPGVDKVFDSSALVSYRKVPRGVTVSQVYGSAGFSWIGVEGWGYDRLYGNVSLRGSQHKDVFLLGEHRTRNVSAGSGNDVISLSGARHGALHGGLGIDTLRYDEWFNRRWKLKVDLADHSATGWHSVRAIENVVGSSYDDLLMGSGGRNRLWGLEGDDRLRGRAGIDHLYGGLGRDACDEQEDRQHSCEI